MIYWTYSVREILCRALMAKLSPKTKPKKKEMTGVYLPPAIRLLVEDIARETGRGISDVVREALQEWLSTNYPKEFDRAQRDL